MANFPKNASYLIVAVVFTLLFGIVLSRMLDEFISLAVVCCISGPWFSWLVVESVLRS